MNNRSNLTEACFTETHENSSKYRQVKTIDLINRFKELGFEVRSANQAKCKRGSKFARHVVRLIRPEHLRDNSMIDKPELVVINSHDARSSLQIRLGIYRLICANGLTIGTDLFVHRIRHQGRTYSAIDKAVSAVVQALPLISMQINQLKQIKLTHHEVYTFAETVAKARLKDFFEVHDRTFMANRPEDDNNDAYTVLNLIQEKFKRGQFLYLKTDFSFNKTRRINSPLAVEAMNQQVWIAMQKTIASKQANQLRLIKD
jgi:hypothetical protein